MSVQTFVYGSNDMEALPCIAGGGGHGLLTWVDSPQSTSAAVYSNIICSQYDGSTWSVPQAVYGGLGQIYCASLAYDPDSNTGIYAFAMSPENNPAVSGDHIYIMKYDGTNWDDPIQVTHNNVSMPTPRSPTSTASHCWSGGPAARSTTATIWTPWPYRWPTPAPPCPRTSPWPTTATRWQWWGRPVGQRAGPLLPAVRCRQRTLGRRDQADRQQRRRRPQPGPQRRLLGQQRPGDRVRQRRTDDPDSQRPGLPGGRRDRPLLGRPAGGHGLAIPAGGLSVQQGNAVPGGTATVCAQVNNTGLFAESNIEVDYYDGDPATGGQQISSATIPGPLAPGDSATAQFTWTVPAGNITHDVYVVASDANATSNEAFLPVVQPDLSLTLSSQPAGEGQYAITASVSNTSGIDISGATLTLSYLNQTTDNPVAITTTPVLISLQAGQSTEIPVLWQSTSDAVYDGEILITGEIEPPAGMQFYSGRASRTMPGDPDAVPGDHRVQPHLRRDQRRSVQHLRTGLQQPITPETGAVSLVSGSSGQVGITTNITGNALTITPDAPLAYDTRYTLTVPRRGDRPINGSLASDFASSFTTAGGSRPC